MRMAWALSIAFFGCLGTAPTPPQPAAPQPKPMSCAAPQPQDGLAPIGSAAGGIQFVASVEDDPLATETYLMFAKDFKGL